ncbi:uncharacterized protein LOC117117168 [Anneissia japonica]|uniref:uncharacterized protein LOC117117168 n=1 Tax=Anneissia japonica TaxID=1529436 RepID=UPI0014258C6B|nr:uncharacterized protein LOC117117168 [Anneissia japonica]
MKMYATLMVLTTLSVVWCNQILNGQLSCTDDSQCAYVFNTPVKKHGQCPCLKDAVKYLCNKYATEDMLQSHLIGYYPFDEDILDHSGNERNGAVSGGTLTFENGVKNQAGKFDGSIKVIVDGFRNFNFGSAFTVSAWFKRTSTSNYQGIVNSGYYSTGSWEIRMGREFSGEMLGGGVITSDSSITWNYSNLRASVNYWHYVVMTYDGETLLFYLDGQMQTGDNDCCSGSIQVKPNPVTIGQAGVGTTNEFFVGLIDEVKLYNTTLSAVEVNALFEEDKP